jgi:hypothetical protein
VTYLPDRNRSYIILCNGFDIDEPVDQFSTNMLIGVAFLFLALRYLMYGQRDYQTGYAFAMVAYIIFFFFRWRREKK